MWDDSKVLILACAIALLIYDWIMKLGFLGYLIIVPVSLMSSVLLWNIIKKFK